MMKTNLGVTRIYNLVREDATQQLTADHEGAYDGLVETITLGARTLADMVDTPRKERLLMASVVLSAAHAVYHERGVPVLVDIDPSTLLEIADSITEREMGL